MAGTGTYTGNPQTSPVDAVRLLIGDTSAPFLLGDAELNYFLLQSPSPIAAAIAAIRSLMAASAGFVDETVGSVSISNSQRGGQLAAILEMLQYRLAIGDSVPYAGGISITDSVAVRYASDRVAPQFTEHTGDSRLTPTYDRDSWPDARLDPLVE